MFPRWVDTYLDILKVPAQEPSFGFLRQICRAHLCTFPFENISKLIYFRDQAKNGYLIPPVEPFLEHHRRFQFGGTCYTLNSNLMSLLVELGFDCHYVMLGLDHIGILVTLPELSREKVYVDCGAAAPFFEPVRFETDPSNATVFGQDRVEIRSTGQDGRYRFSRYINGELSGTAWEFDSNDVKRFEDFQAAIDAANQPGTTFMTMLRCQLWQLDQDRSVSLGSHTLYFRQRDGSQVKQEVSSLVQVKQIMRNDFGLPLLPVEEALTVLRDLGTDLYTNHSGGEADQNS